MSLLSYKLLSCWIQYLCLSSSWECYASMIYSWLVREERYLEWVTHDNLLQTQWNNQLEAGGESWLWRMIMVRVEWRIVMWRRIYQKLNWFPLTEIILGIHLFEDWENPSSFSLQILILNFVWSLIKVTRI